MRISEPGYSASETNLLRLLLTTAPPSIVFVAIGASVLGIMTAVISGLEGSMGSEAWIAVGKWSVVNLLAAGVVTAMVAAANTAFRPHLYLAPPRLRALALSYGTYAASGVVAGLVRLAAIHLLMVKHVGAGFLDDVSAVGAIVLGTLVLGFSANQFSAYLDRIRSEREIEKRFRTIFEKSPLGTVTADLQGRILESNEAFQEIVRYSGEELHGMTYADLTHPDDLPMNLDSFRESLILS